MDKVSKKKLKKIITWAAMGGMVAVLAAMPLLARQEAQTDGPVASILSAEVTEGSISASLHGGGNIEAETVEDVKIPSGVKIESFLVKNGQFVTEGTPLAQLDKVSVMTAITQVGETLDFLREELEAARDEAVSSSIKATAGGRVKKIFAQSGESVQEVMLRDGCLAILSLDGLMAVKLERALPVSTGESVTVTLADGTEVTGRVESNLDDTVVITVEDEGYEVGQSVTVTGEDGQRLGQGSLYIHNAWKATAYTGTIENVNTQEEKTLSSGATLFTVTDRDYEGELRRRSNQHREYEELLQELFAMYESGVLTAPCDGQVEGVDEDSAYLLNSAPEGWVLVPLSNAAAAEETGYRVMLLSSTVKTCTQDSACQLTWQEHVDNGYPAEACQALCQDCHENTALGTHAASCITWCRKSAELDGCNAVKHYKDCIHSCTYGTRTTDCAGTKHHALGCIRSCDRGDTADRCDAKGEHYLDCIRSCIEADVLDKCTASKHTADCIEKCGENPECTGNKHTADCAHYGLTYTAEVGVVKQIESGTILYAYESADPVPAAKNGSSFSISAKPDANTMVNGVGSVLAGGADCKVGDIILIVTGKNSNGTAIVDRKVYVYSATGSAGGMGQMGGMSGFGGMGGGMGGFSMTGGMTGFGNGTTATEEDEGLFDLEGSTLLTVTAHDQARLAISVDEHDIARVRTGMKAIVKLEALKGQEFEAEVTAIAISGTNNGGSSKFEVELTLPMSQDMLSGMSASAVIELEEKQNVLLIPAAALIQEGAKTLVCTALDEDGQPSSPVEVVTGLTDGENVEIISGLEKGQKVYYSYYDNVELDTTAKAEGTSMFG